MGGKRKTFGNDAVAMRQIAQLQVHDTIGRHALDLLRARPAITADDLVAALEEVARKAPKAIGGFEPERLRAEAAIEKLRQLQTEPTGCKRVR